MTMLKLLLVLVFPVVAVAQTGRITARVRDFDTGEVIINAEVHAGFNTTMGKGEGAGGGRPNRVIGYTDSNGICELTGSGNGGSVSLSAGKDGYYWGSSGGVGFANITGMVHKKYQPWNPVIDIKLKSIGNRVPLYAKNLPNQEIPSKGKPVGFDLIKGDWVSPHGAGSVEDVLFTFVPQPELTYTNWYGSSPRPHRIRNYDLHISFPNEEDGLVPIYIKPYQGGSALRLPRSAPVDGYISRIEKKVYREPEQPYHSDYRDDANYFFRVRTVKDQDGNIVSALYGKIQGDFRCNYDGDGFGFTYYLNPAPNDRNVEFDPKKNLFKNLSIREQVRAP